MFKRLPIYILLLFVLTLILVACGGQQVVEVTRVVEQTITEEVEVTRIVTETEVETVTEEVEVTRVVEVEAEAAEPIIIGATGPLSAPGSVGGGIAMQFTAQLAVDEINAAGGVLGRPIELVFVDTQGLPERGTAVAERLIEEDGAVAIIGEYHSAVGLTMIEVCHERHIPCVFSETWNDNITAAGYDEVFRVAVTSTLVASQQINWLDALGFEYVVIIAENTDYGVPASEAQVEFMTGRGIDSEVFFVELGTEDFLPVLTRIQEGERTPDAIMVLVTGETSYNVEQQMAEIGLAPTEETVCVANQVAINAEYWDNVPDGNYCAYLRVGLTPGNYNDTTKSVDEAYRAQFDRPAPSFALATYDSVYITAEAIERAGSTDPDAIIAEIEATDRILAQGHYYFPYGINNPVPDDEPAWMWHQWPDAAVVIQQYFEVGQDPDNAAVVFPPAFQTHDTALIPYGGTP
ncbi:MAG: ABC transporter substrate-binding protein [Chloroflexi bacterium]|nr:MAG: ABC transporter substrate-binding protein [Chloroflexota bacterium]